MDVFRALGISRNGYYAWLKRGVSKRVGQPADNKGTFKTVSGMAGQRVPCHKTAVQLLLWPDPPADEKDGNALTAYESVSKHNPFQPRTSDRAKSSQTKILLYTTEPGQGGRYHLYPD